MNLASIQHTMFDYVLGRKSHAETARELGLEEASPAAERLSVWRRAYVHTLRESAAALFPTTHKVVVGRLGESAWSQLVARVGRERPPVETRFAASGLVDILRATCEALTLPTWVADLADLELTERRIGAAPAPVVPPAQERRALRLVAPFGLRRYRSDVSVVRRAEEPAGVEPEANATVIAIWRSTDGVRRTLRLSATGLRVLQAVDSSDAALAALLAGPLGQRASSALARFRELGLVVGGDLSA